jgi:hypothetical protein
MVMVPRTTAMVARPAVNDLQATDLAVADLEVGEVAQVDAGTAELLTPRIFDCLEGSLRNWLARCHAKGVRRFGSPLFNLA